MHSHGLSQASWTWNDFSEMAHDLISGVHWDPAQQQNRLNIQAVSHIHFMWMILICSHCSRTEINYSDSPSSFHMMVQTKWIPTRLSLGHFLSVSTSVLVIGHVSVWKQFAWSHHSGYWISWLSTIDLPAYSRWPATQTWIPVYLQRPHFWKPISFRYCVTSETGKQHSPTCKGCECLKFSESALTDTGPTCNR